MMTVYRMSEDKIRFRFRISHARIHNKGGDVAAVKAAATPEARAGRGQDVSADLVINVNKDIKNDPNLRTHMLLKKDRPENPGLKAAGEAKNRFAQLSELVD